MITSARFSHSARVQLIKKPSQREALDPSKFPIRGRRLLDDIRGVDHLHYSAASLNGSSKPIGEVVIPREVEANA
jgi:hypothetical protein